MDLGDALAWLDRHQNLERMLADARTATPDPERMRRLVDVLGHPESSAPVIQITGTNGKTSTARGVTSLLMAKGLSVGTFTSPHLERINERITFNAEPIPDGELAVVLSDLAGLEPLLGDQRPTWFELLTAAALRWFADKPVDVMVLEVGLGGRWDATNVADADVAVITNIGLDHLEFLGPTRADVAGEKAGIIKPGTTLVLGETAPELLPIFEAEHPDGLLWAGRDYEVTRNDLAVGGRVLDIRTLASHYDGVWLDLHGRHQVDNFAAALVAVEAFFDAPIETRLVREAAATLRSPGRLEIVGRHPLVVLDGAKNLEGARAAALAVAEELGVETVTSRILVVGMLAGKDPAEMLHALDAETARVIVTCPPPSPRAQPASIVADAARHLVEARGGGVGGDGVEPGAGGDPVVPGAGGDRVVPGAGGDRVLPGAGGDRVVPGAGGPPEIIEAETVADALDVAFGAAGPDDLVLVTGSLYVVGAARAVLRSGRFSAR
jgi:dihydrofolate synthase/folylpolyglutamate synthase